MISLQFSATDTFKSKLIRLFSHGAGYSHVDAILADGTLLGSRADTLCGIPAGVQIRPKDYIPFSKVLRIDLTASDIQTTAFYDFLQTQIGKPYDKRAIIGFLFGRDWRGTSSWFCSELIGFGLEKCDWFPYPLSPTY